MRTRTDYLECIFDHDNLQVKLDEAIATLEKKEFDIIACRGVSGLLFASILAYKMHKGLVVIRKPEHSSHSYLKVEGIVPSRGDKWLIVDDFMSSGRTVAEIISRLGRHNTPGLIGAYMYKHKGFRTRGYVLSTCSMLVDYSKEDKYACSDVCSNELQQGGREPSPYV